MADAHEWLEGLEVVELDSEQLRTLAHPMRNRIVSSLRLEGPATSAVLAERLDTNTGQTSYHLRALAAVGLVVEDPERGTRRERWWKAAQRGHSWSETAFEADPNDRHAANWLIRFYQRQYFQWISDWYDQRGEWPVEWRDAATSADHFFMATPELATALSDELQELLARYRELGEELDPEDPDVKRMTVIYNVFPSAGMRP